MKIIHLSDLHVGESGFQRDKLVKCISEVNKMRPDVVIVTGDLTENGLTNEMMEAKTYLDSIRARKYVTMGNHDARNVGYLKFEKIIGPRWFKCEMPGYCSILGVDSSEPDLDEGEIGKEGRKMVEEDLCGVREQFKIFVLHHHLLPIPLSGRERNVLVDSGDVLRVLMKNNVTIALSGHKHVPYLWNLNGMIVLHAGSASSRRLRGLEENVYNVLDIGERSVSVTLKIIGGGSHEIAKFDIVTRGKRVQLMERSSTDIFSLFSI